MDRASTLAVESTQTFPCMRRPNSPGPFRRHALGRLLRDHTASHKILQLKMHGCWFDPVRIDRGAIPIAPAADRLKARGASEAAEALWWRFSVPKGLPFSVRRPQAATKNIVIWPGFEMPGRGAVRPVRAVGASAGRECGIRTLPPAPAVRRRRAGGR